MLKVHSLSIRSLLPFQGAAPGADTEPTSGEIHDLHVGSTGTVQTATTRHGSSWRQKAALVVMTASLALPTLGAFAQAAEPPAPVQHLTATRINLDYKPADPCSVFCWQPVEVAKKAPLEAQFPMTQTYELPGATTWFDHAEFYAPKHELFVTREDRTQVLDVQSGDLHTIKTPNTQKAHGIAFDPQDGRGFITNGNSNTITIFDLNTLKPIKDIPVGKKPDNIVYDPASHLVWAMIAGDKQAYAINPVSGAIVHKVPLGGHPEMARADGQGHVYAALSDTDSLADINTMTATADTYPLAPSKGPSAMSIDAANHKLFIGSDNQEVVVFDTSQHRVIAAGLIGDADSSQFNARTGQAFFSNADGSVSVVNSSDNKVGGTFFSIQGAKTIALDPSTGTMYFPAPGDNGALHLGVVQPK